MNKNNSIDWTARIVAIIILAILFVFWNAFLSSTTNNVWFFNRISSKFNKTSYESLDDNNLEDTNYNSTISSSELEINSGSNTEDFTEKIENNIIIPENLDDYLNYIIEYWVNWEDFLEQTITDAPQIKYKNPDDNNKYIIYPYIDKNIINFKLPYTDKKWYIAFITNKKIANDRDFLLWIKWKVKWSIRKEKTLSSVWNIYLYELNNLVIAGSNWKWRNLYKDVENWILKINAYVWEKWNQLEKIIIFFK